MWSWEPGLILPPSPRTFLSVYKLSFKTAVVLSRTSPGANHQPESRPTPSCDRSARMGPDHSAHTGPDHSARTGPDGSARTGPDHSARIGPDGSEYTSPDRSASTGPDRSAHTGPFGFRRSWGWPRCLGDLHCHKPSCDLRRRTTVATWGEKSRQRSERKTFIPFPA